VLLETFSSADFVGFLRSVSQHNPVSELCRQYVDNLTSIFCSDMHVQLLDFIQTAVCLYKSCQINWITYLL